MGYNLSDYNRDGASIIARKYLYRDLPLAFMAHPTSGDVRPLTDIDAVKQSVKNLVMTNFLERPFAPNLGSNVTSLLFEPMDGFTAMAMKGEIVRVLTEHESRINGVMVDINDESDRNAYHVTIEFNVVFAQDRQDVNFYLERTR